MLAPPELEEGGMVEVRARDVEEPCATTSEELVGVIVQPVFEIGEHVTLPAHMSGRFLGCLKAPDFEDVHVGGREGRMGEIAQGVGK